MNSPFNMKYYSFLSLMLHHKKTKLTTEFVDEYQEHIKSESLNFALKFKLFRAGYNHHELAILNDTFINRSNKIYQYLYLMDCYYADERDDNFLVNKINQLMTGELEDYELIILLFMIKSGINIDYSNTTQASVISTFLLLDYLSDIDMNKDISVIYDKIMDRFNYFRLEKNHVLHDKIKDNLLLE